MAHTVYGFAADIDLEPSTPADSVTVDALTASAVRSTLGPAWSVGLRAPKSIAGALALPRRTDALILPPGGPVVRSIGRAWDEARSLARALGGEVVPMFDPVVPDELDEAAPAGTDDRRWCLRAMGVLDASDARPHSGKGVRIGHPDTGFTHSDELFDGNPGRLEADRGYDELDDDADPTDQDGAGFGLFGHGTGTASVIMSGDGAVWGVANEARLVPFRVAPSPVLYKARHRAALARAIDRAVDVGCHVISISMGFAWGGAALRQAVARAEQRGVIVVAAAGQMVRRPAIPTPFVVAPASFPELIAAAACDINGKGCGWSARGKAVAVTAYGDAVWKARPPGKQPVQSWGTSFATAHVAGVAALWIQRWRTELDAIAPELRRAAFRQALGAAGLEPVIDGTPGKWGAGVLHAGRVLAVPPSDVINAALRAPASLAGPNVEELTRLLDLPAAQAPDVQRTVERLFRTEPAGVEAFLGEHGPELTDHITREAPSGAVLRSVALGAPPLAMGWLPGAGFLREASSELRSRLRPSAR